ncbi:MAG: hypothetical protein F4X63_03000 [Nitrospira sp. SB0662_bin_26]|nr:hypothetical protein [Nitrospira sp. SB0662_bin_26]
MNENCITKGSSWRKWDLQIHVPGAKHADQYSLVHGGDVWNQFLEHIIDSDVAVFGVTDYFSVAGYETFQHKAKSIPALNGKRFFPCIELRLDISVNLDSDQLQCHLIFDSERDVNDIKTFLAHLPLKNKKTNHRVAYCTDEDIMACGGYATVSVAKEALEQTLKESFGTERPFLIAGVASGMGSNRANSNVCIKRELSDFFDDFCDLFFGHPGNREYYLNESRYENKNRRATAKPVISTSDCHSFDDLQNKLGQKYTLEDKEVRDPARYGFSWIKADTTFEGLKQIIFEPTDRVAFGYEKPESKKSYYLIDKVRFIDNTGEDNFLSDTIEVNHNLAAIVGGKSTGKSLLLHYMAKTIDRRDVEERLASSSTTAQYNFDESLDFNFEVTWTDGARTYLRSIEGNNDASRRKILYIPQNYLNNLSENKLESRETLNKFIREVLLQDEIVRENYENKLARIRELARLIPTHVTNLYQIKQEIEEVEERIRQLGEQEGITKYTAQLRAEADGIKSRSGLSQQEITAYEGLMGEASHTRKNITSVAEDRKTLDSFRRNVSLQLESVEKIRDEEARSLGDQEVRARFMNELGMLGQVKSDILASIDRVVAFVDMKKRVNQEKLHEIQNNLAPFMEKVQLQSELRNKNTAIEEEQRKLDRITHEKINLEAKKERYNAEKTILFETYKEIFSGYDTARNELKEYENKFDDISLRVSVGFNEEKFNGEVINQFLNKQDIKRNRTTVGWKDEYKYQFSVDIHLDFIDKLFADVVDGKIKTVKGRPARDAVAKILEDYFDLDFKISYKRDPLDKMSPGKKGLVLLRLLIDLSNEEWPILLDQPEDDLDNRSVYDDLVSFIKSKKNQRQIIIVTHNPNLVVGADAEQVIVANQDGQEKGRDNRKFKFEYVAGALENTFESSGTQSKAILYRKGIRQHVYEVLEGGKEAFRKREQKYNFKS